jgi:hypothetical protein
MPYTISVTLDTPSAQRISQDLAVITGVADLTSYNATHAEVTPITGKFKTTLAVLAGSLTDNGHVVYWNRTTKAFTAFKPAPARSIATAEDLTIAAVDTSKLPAVYFDGTNGALVIPTDSTAGTVALAPTGSLAAAAGTEAADNTDVGAFNFIAIGLI